jgi:hypothetical protein
VLDCGGLRVSCASSAQSGYLSVQGWSQQFCNVSGIPSRPDIFAIKNVMFCAKCGRFIKFTYALSSSHTSPAIGNRSGFWGSHARVQIVLIISSLDHHDVQQNSCNI